MYLVPHKQKIEIDGIEYVYSVADSLAGERRVVMDESSLFTEPLPGEKSLFDLLGKTRSEIDLSLIIEIVRETTLAEFYFVLPDGNKSIIGIGRVFPAFTSDHKIKFYTFSKYLEGRYFEVVPEVNRESTYTRGRRIDPSDTIEGTYANPTSGSIQEVLLQPRVLLNGEWFYEDLKTGQFFTLRDFSISFSHENEL